MKTNKSNTKTKKAAKLPKAETKSAKKPRKSVSVKTKKTVKKVSKVKSEAKPKKVTKAVTAKKKTAEKVKLSAAKTKKVPTTKKPVKKRTVTKKPEKTVTKKTIVKTKTVTAKKPATKSAVRKSPVKTKTAVKAKSTSRPKTTAKKKEENLKVKPIKQIAIPANKMSFRDAAIKQQIKERAKKAEKTKLKIFLPEKGDVEEIIEDVLSPGLKDEYGENDFFIMPIDPKYTFVNWEITKEAFLKAKGTLNIRAYDITGIIFDGNNFNRFFDININNRSGSGFFEINMQGCDVVMEIGFLQHDGRFKPIIRSNIVSIPSLMAFDELGIVLKLYDAGVPVGY